jgi:anaerobic selenocysteine-containing dehydrogenase
MSVHTTACPRNCYSTCGMRVTVEEGKLRLLEAHPSNRATSEGLCLKGQSYIERVYSADRLLHPMRRREDGRFERIAWDEALRLMAERLAGVRDRYGPRSVLFYSGSGTKGLMNDVALDFWRLFGGCTTTYGDLCWPAGLEATRLTLGDNRHNAPEDLVNARLIVFWGKNPAETNIHQMRFVDEALERGARLIVIDPRRTQTAEGAELLVQVQPGTDGALALGLAHLLIRQGSIDRDFVSRHVLGFEEFARRVEEFPPHRVAAVTDVPVPVLRRLAAAIGEAGPVTLCAGFGMQRYTNSGQSIRAMIALLAITGNLGKPGAGWMYANLQSQIFHSLKDPLALFPPQEEAGPIRVSVSTALLGSHMVEQRDPPLKAAWIERGNPVTQNPDTRLVVEALRALDFRVVVDQFMTDTALEADLVLPAKTLFEQTDVIGAYWHSYIQIKDKLIEPPGEVRPESEIYYHLGIALGLDEKVLSSAIPEPGDAAVETYLRRRLQPFPELTLERLRQGAVLAPGSVAVAWSDLRFPTPSGKIELLSEEAELRWGLDRLPSFTPPEEAPAIDDGPDPQYPLHLLTPNTKDRIHSQFNNLPSIRKLNPKTLVHIHPTDARRRGIANGSRVRVFNQRGSVEIEARLDYGLKPGCVSVTNGWWLSEGGGINRLSAARETDMGHGAAFHDNAVEVEGL